jgi:hypothetical protein
MNAARKVLVNALLELEAEVEVSSRGLERALGGPLDIEIRRVLSALRHCRAAHKQEHRVRQEQLRECRHD